MLTGIFVAASLTLFACRKANEHTTVTPTPTGPHEGHEGDIGGDPKNDQCGGIEGLQCPEGLTCVDDPADSCDPTLGGTDCIGMCVEHKGPHDKCDFAADPNKNYVGQSLEACATMKFVCEEGKEYFADDCGCGCASVE